MLQVNFVGTVDFDSGQFQFDATLFESRILNFTLTGDMAVRVYWKRDANLLLTVGGFHPAYTPPPMNLKSWRGWASSLRGQSGRSRRVVFAVTSNTVQYGARFELAYSSSAFSVQGFLEPRRTHHPADLSFRRRYCRDDCGAGPAATCCSRSAWRDARRPAAVAAKGNRFVRDRFRLHRHDRVRFRRHDWRGLAAGWPPIDVSRTGQGRSGPGQLASAAAGRIEPVGHSALDAGSADTLVLHPYGSSTCRRSSRRSAFPSSGSARPRRRAGSEFASPTSRSAAPTRRSSHARGVRARSILRDERRRKAVATVLFANSIPAWRSAGPAPQTDFMRPREVAYEVIYLPEPHPVQLASGCRTLASSVRWRGSSVAQSPLSRRGNHPRRSATRDRSGPTAMPSSRPTT